VKLFPIFAAIILAFLLFTQAGRHVGVMALVLATQGAHVLAPAPAMTADQREACFKQWDAAHAFKKPGDLVYPRELACQ
jgi:hypothetical protein